MIFNFADTKTKGFLLVFQRLMSHFYLLLFLIYTLCFITLSDGRKIRLIMKNNILQPFSITVFEDEIFWTDTASKAIFRANKFDGTGFNLVKRNIKSPMGISVIQSSRQPFGMFKLNYIQGVSKKSLLMKNIL
jgi:hypothetical protein